jgi:hypothetical protein
MRLRNAVEIIGAVIVAIGGAILFALGYRSRNFGLGEAKSDLADAQDGQRKSTESADRIKESVDLGTRGIDDAQTIIERDGKLIDEAEDIFAKYK